MAEPASSSAAGAAAGAAAWIVVMLMMRPRSAAEWATDRCGALRPGRAAHCRGLIVTLGA